MRSEMSRFTGDIGREEEDGLGWDGLVESGREKRERETYDGLVRDAMLWRKRQIAATDTQSKAQPQHFVETEDPHTLKCKCGFLCVTQDMMRVHIRYPEAKLPDDLPDLDVTFLAAQPQTVDEDPSLAHLQSLSEIEGIPGHCPVEDGYCSCGVLCETGTGFRRHIAAQPQGKE